MKKTALIIFTVCLLILCPIKAKASDFNVDTNTLTDQIPEELREYLPVELFENGDPLTQSNSVSLSVFTRFAVRTLKGLLTPILKTFCSLLAIIIMAAVINSMKNSISSEKMTEVLGYITLLVTSLLSYGILKNQWEAVKQFISAMTGVMNAMLPIMTALYTLGGNVSSAIINTSNIIFSLTLISNIVYSVLLPILKICFALSVTSSFNGMADLSGIAKTLKNIFTGILSGAMSILSIVMLFQTNIAASSDGVAARTLKFAGSFIPVVGSAIGDSVRNMMSGITLIKSASGYIGVIVILVITLPVLLSLYANKISLDAVSGIADIIDCTREAKVLKEFSSILNYSLAITFSVSLLFLFEITVFINTGLALGGA